MDSKMNHYDNYYKIILVINIAFAFAPYNKHKQANIVRMPSAEDPGWIIDAQYLFSAHRARTDYL